MAIALWLRRLAGRRRRGRGRFDSPKQHHLFIQIPYPSVLPILALQDNPGSNSVNDPNVPDPAKLKMVAHKSAAVCATDPCCARLGARWNSAVNNEHLRHDDAGKDPITEDGGG